MNEKKHTPEPWPRLDGDDLEFNVIDRASGEPAFFVMVDITSEPDIVTVEMGAEDYNRAVACVNICTGIPTESLEGAGNLQKAAFAQIEDFNRVSDQRDQLLAALKQARDAIAAFQDPDGRMPEETGEFHDLEVALVAAELAIAAADGGA